MKHLGTLLVGAIAFSASLASSYGCSGPDPGAITFSERQGATGEPGGGSSSSASGSGSSSGGSGSSSGGSGTDGGPAPPDPIFGMTAFAWVDPGQVANTAGAANHPGMKVEGQDCLVDGCHKAGAQPWVMGGTVYTNAAGAATVPKAEIQIVGPDGKPVAQAFTDANGNFWLGADGKTIPAGSKVGVRRQGSATKMMVAALQPTDGGCTANRANCHGTAATGKVYIP